MKSFNLLKGKNVLVTGATGGIGKFICSKFISSGSNVFAVGRSKEKLDLLSKSLGNIKIYNANLADIDSINDLNNQVTKDSGGIDILINNAGIFYTLSIDDINKEEYDSFFNINVRAPILLSSFHSNSMKLKNWGRIFNIGSSSSYNGGKYTSLYCATKHALLGFSRSMSDELKKFNIRVTNLSPSSTKTNIGKIPLATNQDYNTFIDPEEVAEELIFLCNFNSNMEVKEILLNRVWTQ